MILTYFYFIIIVYGRDLDKDIHSETSGQFREVMLAQAQGNRDTTEDVMVAIRDAEELTLVSYMDYLVTKELAFYCNTSNSRNTLLYDETIWESICHQSNKLSMPGNLSFNYYNIML